MAVTATDRPAVKPPGRRPVQRRRQFTGRTALILFAFMVPALVFVGLFTYYPLLNGISMAFRNYNLNDLTDTSWVGLKNFRTLLDDEMFRGTVKNSVVWVVGSLVPQFLIGFAMALWLRRKFRFRGTYQALVFFPWAVSGFLIGILFRWMFNGEFGVVNDLLMKSHLIRYAGAVAGRREVRDGRGHRRERLVRRDVLRDHDPRRAAVGARGALRGLGDRRCGQGPHVVQHHHPVDPDDAWR